MTRVFLEIEIGDPEEHEKASAEYARACDYLQSNGAMVRG